MPDLPSPFAGPLSRDDITPLVTVLRALADPTRLQILSMIQSARGGELTVSEFPGPLGLAQPTCSHHLRILTDAGLIERREHGTWGFYRLAPRKLTSVSAAIRPKGRRR